MRPSNKQILAAAENLGNEYSCFSLSIEMTGNLWNEECSREYSEFYGSPKDDVSHGWFGNPKDEQNQLTRSIALLLYKEARADVLGKRGRK